MPRLSAFVCAHNEEDRLAECLARLRFADEIVVLLDRTTDRSIEIAKAMADVVITGVFPLEGPRREAALASCTGDWILEIDADEYVSADLAAEIRRTLRSGPAADHFLLPVDNYIGARLVRHGWGGSFGTSAVTRLYRQGVKQWHSERVHPGVTLTGKAGGRLVHPIAHKVDDDVSDMIRRLDRYTELRANDLVDSGRIDSLWSAGFRGVRRFWKCYVSRKGYREGVWGVLIATMSALFAFLSVLRARLILSERRAAEALTVTVETPAQPAPKRLVNA
jgi:glycosyltransferase involved in cell wall biosynthesis